MCVIVSAILDEIRSELLYDRGGKFSEETVVLLPWKVYQDNLVL